MIRQNEIEKYIKLKKRVDDLREQLEAQKANLIHRVQSNENIQAGFLSLSLKVFDKTTTKYKEILNSLKEVINQIEVPHIKTLLLNMISKLLRKYSSISVQSKLDAAIQSVKKVA
ncbi:MAG: hypothetical protein V3U54_08850 [Thermodesulfobacteriota bacterium]